MPPRAKTSKTDLLRGTLDLLVLRTLEAGALHGVAIADRIHQLTQGTFHVQAGSLFPALHRLEDEGRIAGTWTTSDAGRRIKNYALTAGGRTMLASERRTWERIVLAVGRVLDPT
jgi:transcriptional regulator